MIYEWRNFEMATSGVKKIAAEILKMSKDNMTANRIQMLWDHYKKDVNTFVDKVNETVKKNSLSMVADKGWLLRFLENLTGKSWKVQGYQLRMANKEASVSLDDLKDGIEFTPKFKAKKFVIKDDKIYKRGPSDSFVEIRVRDMVPELLLRDEQDVVKVIDDFDGNLDNLRMNLGKTRKFFVKKIASGKVLTKQQREEMMNDAHKMNATTWYKKYPIGDYDDYKNMYKRQYENMIGGGYPFASAQQTIKCARSFKSLDDFKSEIAKSAHAVEAEFKGDTYYVLAKLSSDKYLNIEEYVSDNGTIDYVGSTNEYNQRSSTGWVPFNTKELKSTIKDYLSHSKTSPMKLIEVLK